MLEKKRKRKKNKRKGKTSARRENLRKKHENEE
jgi:hypothetical protein